MPSILSPLARAVLEIEQHVARQGWDAPPRLFALADTADLLAREPALAAQLGFAAGAPAEPSLTPVEQDGVPADRALDEVLGSIEWPAEVAGCVLVVERLMLPPSAEAALAEQDPAEADGAPDGGITDWVAQHPDREEVRLVVGVLRTGARECAVRLRSHDRDDAVLSGPDLVPTLADALAATLE